MPARRPAHRSLREIFAAPLVIAVLSTIGLVAALVGDGVWDVASWATLGVPVLLFAVFLARRSPT